MYVKIFIVITLLHSRSVNADTATNWGINEGKLWHKYFHLGELTEFNKSTLEVLRQPLEDRKITISRAKYTVEYPCSFMFVASMNPCPCGYYGDPTHQCTCTPGQISRYLSKISGPLLDRIDLHCEVPVVPFKQLSQMQQGEASRVIRERVIRARQIQMERFSSLSLREC